MHHKIKREQTTIQVWNICECGHILFSIAEGKRGTCSGCWVKSLSPEKHKAMKRLIASAFNGSTDDEKNAAVDAAFKAMEKPN